MKKTIAAEGCAVRIVHAVGYRDESKDCVTSYAVLLLMGGCWLNGRKLKWFKMPSAVRTQLILITNI